MKSNGWFIRKMVYVQMAVMGLMMWPVRAQSSQVVSANTIDGDSIKLALTVIAAVLLLIIFILANAAVSAIEYRQKQEKEQSDRGKLTGFLSLFIWLLPAWGLRAQEAASVVTPANNGWLSGLDFSLWLIILAVVAELGVILYLIRIIKQFTGIADAEKARPGRLSALSAWWQKINNFVPIEQEAGMDTGHNYDGIRELDNVTPPWFKAAFIASIVFAFGYMYRYHVVRSAPLMIEEYNIAMKKAAAEHEEFLKNQKNSIDENTITLLGAEDVSAGKAVFTKNCIACHGNEGQGNAVGPNLTDDYWIHGGSIKDVFKTIKYGYVEKGMKSWKDELSPLQIAQAASFIKSIRGTNAPAAKEPQGELYQEEATTKGSENSPSAAADTTVIKQ